MEFPFSSYGHHHTPGAAGGSASACPPRPGDSVGVGGGGGGGGGQGIGVGGFVIGPALRLHAHRCFPCCLWLFCGLRGHLVMWGGWWAVMEVEGVMGTRVGGWWWFEGKDRCAQLSRQQESAWKTGLSCSKLALSTYEPSGAKS